MAERSSLTQTVQWGVETVGSTAATAANILMSAMGFEPSPKTTGDSFRPAGRKYKTLSWIGKEWSEGSLTGQATYTEMIYPLASVLSAPTTSKPTTGSYQYTFTSSATGADTPRTYTIEAGEPNNFNQISGVIMNEMSLSFTRDQIELGGSAYGRALSYQTGSLTTVTQTPTAIMVLPAEVTVQWHTTYAGVTGTLGTNPTTNKLSRVLSVDWSISDRYNPVWVLDASQSSYVASVEGEPTVQATILMEADAAGMARLDELKNSTTVFMRVSAASSQLADAGGTTQKYAFELVMAGKVSDTGGYSDQDGLYAIEWSLTGIYDATLGSPVRIAVVNNIPFTSSRLNIA